jgi:G2/mitotic-specific cyclin 1/2
LAHYSGYKEEELLPCANVLLNYILKYPQHDAIYKKYASRKFCKASVYMRSWALERWDEGSDVDLGACLDALLEDSALRRKEGKAAVVYMVPDPPHMVEEEVKK